MTGTLSANFAFLATDNGQLERLAALAERYFADDPNSTLIKLRQFGELLAQHLITRGAATAVVGDGFIARVSDRYQPWVARGAISPNPRSSVQALRSCQHRPVDQRKSPECNHP